MRLLNGRWRQRLIIVICTLSVCLNGYFAFISWKQRAPDYQGMDMFPYYLAIAYHSYDVEFNPNTHPNVHGLPGRPMIDEAFSAFQAARPLYERYGYRNLNTVYQWMYYLEYSDSSDITAYQQLFDIKSVLPLQGYIKPSQIQPLLDEITKEYLRDQPAK